MSVSTSNDISTIHRRRRSSTASTISVADFKDTIKNAVQTATTITWNEIPDWMKDNEYILTGYRKAQGSWYGCWESLFSYVHNESVNVHTHLWPSLLFLVLLSFTIIPFPSPFPLVQYPTTSLIDRSYISIFLLSAFFCLGCSAIFHLAGCHSESAAKFWGCLDYSGIIALIVGSFYPCVYYAFACETTFQLIYLGGITVLGLCTAVITFLPRFSTPAFRPFRAALFISLGLSAVIPVSHLLYTHGFMLAYTQMGLSYLFLSGGLYILGAVIYANRWPEKWFPGKFDLFLSSHQIFHVHVVLAALAHYVCVVKAYSWWHGVRGGICH